MYAVVAPGFSAVYTNWEDVERIKALYFYPQWAKVNSEEEAQKFIKRHQHKGLLNSVHNYGDSIADTYIEVSYTITQEHVYYKLNVKHLGQLLIYIPNTFIEYHGDYIYIRQDNVRLSPETISSHMSVIYNLLKYLGDCVDIQLNLDNFAVYYCLTNYHGKMSRAIKATRELIQSRLCQISYTLENLNGDIYGT